MGDTETMNCTCCGTTTGHEWGGVPLCETCQSMARTPTNRLPPHNIVAEVRGIINHLLDMGAALSGEDGDDAKAAAVRLGRILERRNAA